MALILTVLGVSAAIAFICFAVSGVIMLIKRKNHKGEGKVKKPWYVITMRVIGVLATIPLVLAATIVIYVLIVDGIDNGADVNHANNCGFTPILMCADMRSDDEGGIEIAELLFEAGADPYAITNYNQDILWLIHRHGNGGYHSISELTELIEIAPLTYGFYVEDK